MVQNVEIGWLAFGYCGTACGNDPLPLQVNTFGVLGNRHILARAYAAYCLSGDEDDGVFNRERTRGADQGAANQDSDFRFLVLRFLAADKRQGGNDDEEIFEHWKSQYRTRAPTSYAELRDDFPKTSPLRDGRCHNCSGVFPTGARTVYAQYLFRDLSSRHGPAYHVPQGKSRAV